MNDAPKPPEWVSLAKWERGSALRNGRTTEIVGCPFCGETYVVSAWSFAGSGKRCKCGAMLSRKGARQG